MRVTVFIHIAICFAVVTGCDRSAPSATPTSQSAQAAKPMVANTATSGDGPRWSCKETVHDFGTVWQGATLKHPFELKNEGNALLTLLQAKASCGCSMAEGYTKEIPPGGSGVVPFSLNTTGKEGAVKELITVKTNSTGQGDLILEMTGTVMSVCSLEIKDDLSWTGTIISPEALAILQKHGGAFGTITSSTKLRRVIKMKNSSGKPLTLTLTSTDPADSPFKGELKETVPDEEYELTITAEPPHKQGQLYGAFRFQTSVAEQPNYQVIATAYVPARIDINPPKVILDPRYSTQKFRHVRITNHGQNPLEITSVASSDPRIKTTIMPGSPGRAYLLIVEISSAEYRPPAYGEIIRIETSDAEFARIDVPVVPTWNKAPEDRPLDRPLKFYPGNISTSQPGSNRIELGPITPKK